MATVTLRPVSDILISELEGARHQYPSDDQGLYSLLSESVADDAATYAYWNSSVSSSISSGYRFGLNLSQLPRRLSIDRICIYFRGTSSALTTGYFSCGLVVGDNTYVSDARIQFSSSDSYETRSVELSSATCRAITSYSHENNSLPDINLQLNVSMSSTQNINKNYTMCLTQLYAVIDYTEITDIGIHHKSGGKWIVAHSAFQKINGAWSRIGANDCKTAINSNLIIDKCNLRGHVEILAPDIAPTCGTEGATGGKYCSKCGKILKPHDTVLPLSPDSHVYTAEGKCKYCLTLSPNAIEFTVNSSTYTAMGGMTWGEWIREDGYQSVNLLKPSFWIDSNHTIYYCTSSRVVYTVGASISDVINNGATYSVTQV